MRIYTGEKRYSCSECLLSFSHWKETFQLFRVFKVMFTVVPPEGTYEGSHWRETLQLYRLFPNIHKSIPPEETYDGLHWREHL